MLSKCLFFVANLSREHKIFHRALLVLYVLSAAVYFWCKFYLGGAASAAVVLKCVPIWILILFILAVWRFQRPNRYPISMIFGLLMSFLGDACLTQDDDTFFILGLITFALAHVGYMKAFTLTPLNLRRAVKIYALCIGSLIVYLLLNHHVTQKLSGGRLYLVGGLGLFYCMCLYGSFWRAVARITSMTDLREWANLTKCVGTVLFILSDNILIVNHFFIVIPYAWVPTMLTYYTAQLFLALSVVQPTGKGNFIFYIPPTQTHPVQYSSTPSTPTSTQTNSLKPSISTQIPPVTVLSSPEQNLMLSFQHHHHLRQLANTRNANYSTKKVD